MAGRKPTDGLPTAPEPGPAQLGEALDQQQPTELVSPAFGWAMKASSRLGALTTQADRGGPSTVDNADENHS
jgi:hypothetical protein